MNERPHLDFEDETVRQICNETVRHHVISKSHHLDFEDFLRDISSQIYPRTAYFPRALVAAGIAPRVQRPVSVCNETDRSRNSPLLSQESSAGVFKPGVTFTWTAYFPRVLVVARRKAPTSVCCFAGRQ